MEFFPIDSPLIKLHRQAGRLSRRGEGMVANRNWYEAADRQPLQWHLLVNGAEFSSYIYRPSIDEWAPGPAVPRPRLEKAGDSAGGEQAHGGAGGKTRLSPESREELQKVIRGLVDSIGKGQHAGLGIILHVCDSLAIRKLAPQFEEEPDHDSLDQLLIEAPEVALGDKTLVEEATSWRLLSEVDSGNSGPQAISISSRYAPIVEEMREFGRSLRLPIVVEARSAALELLAWLTPSENDASLIASDNKSGSVLVIRYPQQTISAIVNQDGTLDSLRVLPKAIGAGEEASEVERLLRNLTTLGDHSFGDVIFLDRALPREEAPDFSSLKNTFPEVSVRIFDEWQLPGVLDGSTGTLFPESAFIAAKKTEKGSTGSPFEFAGALDFYCLPESVAARIPDLRTLKLARTGLYFRICSVFLVSAWAFMIGSEVLQKLRSEEWQVLPSSVDEQKMELQGLISQRNRWRSWDDLLKRRSEGAVAMALPLVLFGEDDGILLDRLDYRLNSDLVEEPRVGFVRNWEFSGYLDPERARDLSNLGSERKIESAINDLADDLQSLYLATTEQTELDVTFQQRQSAMPVTTAFPIEMIRRYRAAFDLTIRQKVSPKSENSLPGASSR
ncbi:hypothetical protein N9406_03615 [Verrucomicrobiales bacterium]|nr:hypothetical protein [Verrucomicrobiales bacterium]